MKLIKHFSEVRLNDIVTVGGKNASLGEMYRSLSAEGLNVPEGFAITSEAYWLFLNENNFLIKLSEIFSRLNTITFNNLSDIGLEARTLILSGVMPDVLRKEILDNYHALVSSVGTEKTFAIRSSATAEDLPNASFAGQQETYLNVKGEENLIKACHRCYASLFTDRAIH